MFHFTFHVPRLTFLTVVILLILALAVSASAASSLATLALPRSVLLSGGTAASSSTFHLFSSTGQPVAGKVNSAHFVLCSGFNCPDLGIPLYLPLLRR